jgi:serine/threonine protein kinase
VRRSPSRSLIGKIDLPPKHGSEQLEEDDEMAMQSEIDILSRIDHPNVVKLIEIFDSDECLYLVLEIMTGGEVSQTPVLMFSSSTELSKRSTTRRKRQPTRLDPWSMPFDTAMK